MKTRLQGIPVSGGVVICPAAVFTQTVCTGYAETVAAGEAGRELSRFRKALAAAIDGLKRDQAQAAACGRVQADIMVAHLVLLEDKTLAQKIEALIQDGLSAEYAVNKAAEECAGVFADLEDEYMRARSDDIRDIGRRLLRQLTGQIRPAVFLGGRAVLVADELMPSDTALLDKALVAGIVTARGGKTSHTAILSRTMGIPAVAGVGSAWASIGDGDLLIVDGAEGVVYVNPDQDVIARYREKETSCRKERNRLAGVRELPSETQDGKKIEIAANIGKPEEMDRVLEVNADGIGLFRTEFLFMDRDKIPGEEEQFAAYKAVLEALPGKKVVIRTLDAGGDKELCYLHLPPEENPALGLRAIRICLAQRQLFKAQLRALLRAGVYGDLHIMFPMISGLNELRQARQVLQEAERELKEEGMEHAEDLPVGIMVEVPSAALLAEALAGETDFFSIGTNDLVQYTLAVDRMNHQVAHLNDYFDPAVLKLIDLTCRAARKAGIFVGICGEMAGDPLALPLLVGMGLDELSMNPGAVLPCRERLRNLSSEKAVQYAGHALQLASAEEVREYAKGLQSFCGRQAERKEKRLLVEELTVNNPSGLHARPAANFVKTAGLFRADITVSHAGRAANAKSILEVLSLGAGRGAVISLRAEGDDAEEALRALKELARSGFGER